MDKNGKKKAIPKYQHPNSPCSLSPINQAFIKTFQKRVRVHENGESMNLTSNLSNSFTRSREDEQKEKIEVKTANNPKIQNGNSKSKSRKKGEVQRFSLISPAYQQQSLASSRLKMRQINHIFIQKISEDPRQVLEGLYQSNQLYEKLLCKWQKQENYDQNDKLVYQLVQHLSTLIETSLQKSVTQLASFMKLHQNILTELETANQKNRQIEQYKSLIQNLKGEVQDNYDKNQWSTLILNSLANQRFDIQSFVRTFPCFGGQQSPKYQQRVHQDYQRGSLGNIKNSEVMVKTKFSVQHLKVNYIEDDPLASDMNSEVRTLRSECTSIKNLIQEVSPFDVQ